MDAPQFLDASGNPIDAPAALDAAGNPLPPTKPAEPSTNDTIRNVLSWGAKALGGAFMGPAGVAAAEHPGATLATAAIPGVIGVASEYGGPALRTAAGAAGKALSHPATGAAIGAYEGRKGGIEGMATGAAIGAAGSTATGRLLKRLGLDTSPSTRMVQGMSEAGAATSHAASDAELLDAAIQRGFAKHDAAFDAKWGTPPAATPAPTPAPRSSTLQDELMARLQNVDWRTQDAVPINAMQAKGILEPGESRVGLAERAAMSKDPAEIELLRKALRQRMHISAKH